MITITEAKIKPAISPPELAKNITSNLITGVMDIATILAAIGDLPNVQQILSDRTLTVKMLTPWLPPDVLDSLEWTAKTSDLMTIPQATLVEFMIEADNPPEGIDFSLSGHTKTFAQRAKYLPTLETRTHRFGEGPIAVALTSALQRYIETEGASVLEWDLSRTRFSTSDDLVSFSFPEYLQPVFAIDSIRSRVVGILAENLQRVGDLFLSTGSLPVSIPLMG